MKSLSDNYLDGKNSSHETFSDLIFCALIVLILFVMALAIEVSLRVRADNVDIPEVAKIEEIETLSLEELVELSNELRQQEQELRTQAEVLANQKEEISRLRKQVQNQASALSGEQRFTGATEPSMLQIAYDYNQERFVFIRRKEFEHAVTQLAGETYREYDQRSTEELVELALLSRNQRFYSVEEANAIFGGFSEYQQVNPTADSYDVTQERVSVFYSKLLSAYIAGDSRLSTASSNAIETAVNSNFRTTAGSSEAMYPSVRIVVDSEEELLNVNGVMLTAQDLKEILLATGGRGAMLDFEGYSGAAPSWLVEKVLKPTGYVGKTPKAP